MPWVTEEEIQAAKNMTAYEYLLLSVTLFTAERHIILQIK